MRRLLPFLVLIVLLGTPLAAQIEHPTPINLQERSTAIIRRSDTLSGDPATDALARRLRALRVTGHIGGEASSGGADFGSITDLTLDRAGRVLVLDDQDKSISRWSATGAPLGRFGRAGGGPLEFNWPNGVEVLVDGTLVVGDRQFGLKRIRWNSAPAYVDTWQAGVTYDNYCADGAGVVAHGSTGGNTVIDALDGTGKVVRSFGVPYQDPSDFTARSLSRGRVGCLQDGRVASVNEILPYVWLWERSGAPAATVQLEGLAPMMITENGQSVTYRGRPGGFQAVRQIVSVGSDHFLVQFAHQTNVSMRERADYAELWTFLLSTRTGRGLFLGTSLPLIGAAPLPKVYGWRNDPVPEVVIME